MLNFLKYNNAIPILFSVLFLSITAAFASTTEGRDAILSSQSKVISMDNTYLVGMNLDTYTPRVEIVNVSEDGDSYYVTYHLSTIDVVDGTWKDVVKEKVLTVAKTLLAEHGDLGLYATEQLKEVVSHESSYLKEVQGFERAAVSQKQISTTYSGLIGKFLDEHTETLPGYVPVVPPEQGAPAMQAAAGSVSSGESASPQSQPQNNSLLTIVGNNPVRIPRGTPYIDLGVIVNPSHAQYGVHYLLDGVEVTSVMLTGTEVGTHTVRYELRGDQVLATAERTVEIYDPSQEVTQQSTSTATTTQSQVATSSTGIDVQNATSLATTTNASL